MGLPRHKMISALRLLIRWRGRHLQLCLDCGIRMMTVCFRRTAIGSYAGRRLAGVDYHPCGPCRWALIYPLSTTRSVPHLRMAVAAWIARTHRRPSFSERACGDPVADGILRPRCQSARPKGNDPDPFGRSMASVDRLGSRRSETGFFGIVFQENRRWRCPGDARCSCCVFALPRDVPKIRQPYL
jgi:hypothetical protein